MLEENNNVGDFSMYNTIGFSCVTLWIMIIDISSILYMYQVSCGIYQNKNNPNLDPDCFILPSSVNILSLI